MRDGVMVWEQQGERTWMMQLAEGGADWIEVKRFDVLGSRPSPVETSLRQRPARTLVAAAGKAPWHVVKGWPFVGGWEWAARATR